MKNDNKLNEPLLVASVTSSAFLLEAVKELHFKTPKIIADYVEKHKYDFIIQNPPYDTNK